jgi:hypothetical protein
MTVKAAISLSISNKGQRKKKEVKIELPATIEMGLRNISERLLTRQLGFNHRQLSSTTIADPRRDSL